MKYTFSLFQRVLFIFALTFVSFTTSTLAATYYLSPSGSDTSGNGTQGNPWFSLNKGWEVLQPGDTLYLRGGTYVYSAQIQGYVTGKNGTAGNTIKVWAYPGETPIITKNSSYQNNIQHWRGGVFFSGDYFHWKGIKFMGFRQNNTGEPFIWRGFYAEDANFNTFELLESYSNEHGMSLQGNSRGNLFLNCDAHHNWDVGTGGGNADGIGINYISANDAQNPNVIRGSRAWWNGDDGFDGWGEGGQNGVYVIENSWSWHNGFYPYVNGTYNWDGNPNSGTFNLAGNGEGFKMGGGSIQAPNTVLRVIKNTIAYKNKNKGYDQNDMNGIVHMYNNTAYLNTNHGINLNQNNNNHVFVNNVSFGNGGGDALVTGSSQTNSTGNTAITGWTMNASAADFSDTTNWQQLSGSRQSDGSLPTITFLQLAAGSDLIDTGTVVSGNPGGGKYRRDFLLRHCSRSRCV